MASNLMWRSLVQFILSLLLLTSINTYAEQITQIQGAAAMTKNLAGVNYDGRAYVNILIEEVLTAADKTSAHQLSTPFLASAIQGNDNAYQSILPSVWKGLNTLSETENPKKAWLLGRVLAAADAMSDQRNVKRATAELKTLLENVNTPQDNPFIIYAWGYLASTEYSYAKDKMLAGMNLLYQQYIDKKNELVATGKELSDDDKRTLQDLLSTATWSAVMNVQAAANTSDQGTYQSILEKMKTVTAQTSVTNALSTSLTIGDASAWAIGIMRLAAATMKDINLYPELIEPFNKALADTKEAKINAAVMLAIVNAELGKERLIAKSELQKTNGQIPQRKFSR